MADGVVNISAGTGTPIRVLTGMGTSSADQQVVTLADQYGSLALSGPDGTIQVDDGATSLAFETFDGTLANQWTTGGTAVPTQVAGLLTFNAGTTASATSYITSINPLGMNANSYLQAGWVLQFDTTASLANSTRWWGYGQNAANPSSVAPITNGVIFMLDATAGAFYAAVYSGGTRTQTVTLTKPTDGAFHRFQIYFRTSRAYFIQDGVNVATISYPNTAVSNSLYLIAGQANAGTAPTSAPTLVASVASAADGGANNHTISDGTYPSVRATVKKASTAVAATDTALAVGLHPSTPLPAGTNTIGSMILAGSGGLAQSSGTLSAAGTNTPGTASTASNIGQVVANVATAGNVTFAIVTSAFVGTLAFEGAVDAGLNYGPLMAIREDGTGAENSTAISTAAAFIRIYTVALPGLLWFRVRVSAFTSGTAAIVLAPGPFLVEPTPSLGASSAVIGTTVQSPILTAAATNTTVVASAPGATGTIGHAAATITAAVTTSAAFIAAPGAGLSIYITDINVTNSGASGTLVSLFASGQTVPLAAKYVAPTTSAPPTSLRTPIRVGTATALNYTNSVASTSVFVQVTYYVAP